MYFYLPDIAKLLSAAYNLISLLILHYISYGLVTLLKVVDATIQVSGILDLIIIIIIIIIIIGT